MSLEDIKSPLPPRRATLPTEPEPEEQVSEIPQERLNLPKEEIKSEVKSKFKWIKNKWVIIGIATLLVLIISLVIFSFIQSKKKAATEIVTLNYWGLWEDQSVMNTIISDFESKNPGVKVNYKRGQRTDYRTRLAGKLVKTGTGNEDVDIFRFHNTWVPMMKDYLEPVPTEVVSAVGLESDFLDIYKNDLKLNGKWVSIPIMYDGLALFYNKDLLTKASLPVPDDWWELRESAIKLTQKDKDGKILVAGAALGLANANVDHWSDIVGLMMKQNNINLAKISSTDMDENLGDVLKFYASFAKSATNVWNGSLPSSTQLFASGKLAFYFGPSWRVFDIQNLNKDLNYGITTVPQLPTLGLTSSDSTQLTNNHWASYWTEGVNNRSKHKTEAWKFLQYLSSNEALEKMYTAESQLRSFGEIYPRKSMSEKLKSNEKVWPFLSVANNASSWYLASETGDEGVNTEMQKYFTDAINGISQTSSSEDTKVLSTLKTGISQIQQKYSLNK